MREYLTQESHDLCKKFWDWRLRNFPEFATCTGEHCYDDQLTNLSIQGFNRRCTESRQLLAEIESRLEKMNKNHGASCSTLKLLASELRIYISGFAHETYLYPINQCEGPHTNFHKLLRVMPQNTVDDFGNIFSRMKLFSNQICDVIELMKAGVTKQKTMHKCSIVCVTKQLKDILNSPIEKCLFYEIFLKKPFQVSPEDWDELRTKAFGIIGSIIFPALQRLIHFLDTQYLPNCREKISVETLPNGREYYASCLKYHTSTTLSPSDIHSIGIKEVQRIQNRFHVLLHEIGYTGAYIELIQTINKNNITPCSDGELISGYSDLYEQILENLPKLFNTLPERPCEIKTTRNPTFPGGCYIQGDCKNIGVFWVNTDKVKSMSFKSTALALHEMIPGHHLQSDVILQKQNMSEFRRFRESGNYNFIPARFPLYTAYIEGWALYSEGLGEEVDVYKNSNKLLGRLYNEIFRAARLVVDTGIHAFDWSTEQAISYLRDVVGMDTHFATSEVCRYITWPGQACSYKIGELKIKELRHQTMVVLGNGFNVKEFHDVILLSGEVPFERIEKNLNLYVQAKRYDEEFDMSKIILILCTS